MRTHALSREALAKQYEGSSNLEARVRLHERFSVNQYGWHRWIFDQFVLPNDALILETGCGVGKLWRENANRIPQNWRVILTDFSAGMLAEAQRNTAGIDPIEAYGVVDVLQIPYADRQFDAVIANHMLYYLSDPADKACAFSGIQRVLKAGGCFYASTNGERHMREMVALVHEFDPSIPFVTPIVGNFSLENGPAQIADWFIEVQTQRFRDELIVTDVDALIDFVLSMSTVFALEEDRRSSLSAHIRRRFVEMGGTLRVAKDAGIIIAKRA